MDPPNLNKFNIGRRAVASDWNPISKMEFIDAERGEIQVN